VSEIKYDLYNRLAEINTATGKLEARYDALGRLHQTIEQSGVCELVYLGQRIVEWAVDGSVVGQAVPMEGMHRNAHHAAGGAYYSPVTDPHYSVIGWIDGQGEVAARSVYDPFGQVLDRSQNWPARFSFGGYWQDELAGLYHLPVRTYLAHFGRFLQPD